MNKNGGPWGLKGQHYLVSGTKIFWITPLLHLLYELCVRKCSVFFIHIDSLKSHSSPMRHILLSSPL